MGWVSSRNVLVEREMASVLSRPLKELRPASNCLFCSKTFSGTDYLNNHITELHGYKRTVVASGAIYYESLSTNADRTPQNLVNARQEPGELVQEGEKPKEEEMRYVPLVHDCLPCYHAKVAVS